jgi:hypothetical protein
MLLLAVDVGMSDLMIDVILNDPILLISDLYMPFNIFKLSAQE